MEIELFIARSDNYGVLIRDPASGKVAAIDAPDFAAIDAALQRRGWKLDTILVTHRHFDHIEGIPDLVAKYGATVIAPAKARSEVPGADRYVDEGDAVEIGTMKADIWAVPGHCSDHIAYHFAGEKVIFVGDVLFVMGCGRVQPGQMDRMWTSLSRLMALPGDVRLLGGHDYTLSNARFARSVDSGNEALKARFAEAETAKAEGRFWALTTVAAEKATNPFFRAAEPALAKAVGLAGAAPGEVFAALREAKNRF